VEFVQQSVSDVIVHVGIRFTDKTVFSLHNGYDMLDVKTSDYEVIRKQMRQ